jgi:hypothetical protein
MVVPTYVHSLQSTFRQSALACLLLCALTIAPPTLADTTDERFLSGLRDRQLFGLAESYCQERLADPALPLDRQAELTVELSRTLLEHALQTPPAEADPLWTRALDAPGAFLRDHPDIPLALLARVQGALVLLARGELSRQQAELSAANPTLLSEARGYLRTALRELSAADQAAGEQLRRPDDAARDGISREQVRTLQNNVRYQLGRALRNQALCYPPGSPDRANALVQAVEQLGPLAQLDASDPIAWPARLDEIACFRLSGEYDRAAQRLEALAAAEPPTDVTRRAAAERIRLALAQDNLDGAIQFSNTVSPEDARATADLDLARLETALIAWQQATEAKDDRAARQWEARASALVEDIQRHHPPFWTRRAEALLAGHVSTAGTSNNLAMLVRAAEGHFRGGQLDEALAAYDRAGAKAVEQRQPDEAFRLGYAAATIEHERRGHRAAADRYRRLALDSPRHPQAAEAHLLAIYNASQAARSRPGASLDEYTAWLDEHLQQWPDGPTANQAWWLLARLREHQADWPRAIEAYQHVGADHEEYAGAIDGVGRCYERLLSQRRAAHQPTDEPAAAAARWFEGLILGDDNRLPERWSPVELSAAARSARLWLRFTSGNADRADRILAAALAGADRLEPEAVPPGWRTEAGCLSIAALAGQGRFDEARGALERLHIDSPAAAKTLLQDLGQLSAAVPQAQRAELADLQARVARLLGGEGDDLDADSRKALDLAEARALAAAGKRTEAALALGNLAADHPRDGQVQEEYGQALLEAGDRASLELALAQWREVERHSRQGGDRWFRARYGLARAYERLGDTERAAKVITSTQTLYPTLGGAELKEQFASLLERCRRKPMPRRAAGQ